MAKKTSFALKQLIPEENPKTGTKYIVRKPTKGLKVAEKKGNELATISVYLNTPIAAILLGVGFLAASVVFAGVLLTGGIVGYETNTDTGGVGVRYLGIGITDEYRKDMVTVALRLISVQTGEVLLAVSSQKTILSTKLSATVFKFLDMGTRMLETEAGITDNESITYAVRKAIEQAVIEIIKEGEKKQLWKFKQEEEI